MLVHQRFQRDHRRSPQVPASLHPPAPLPLRHRWRSEIAHHRHTRWRAQPQRNQQPPNAQPVDSHARGYHRAANFEVAAVPSAAVLSCTRPSTSSLRRNDILPRYCRYLPDDGHVSCSDRWRLHECSGRAHPWSGLRYTSATAREQPMLFSSTAPLRASRKVQLPSELRLNTSSLCSSCEMST